jgi:hypothetical protein
MKTCVETSISLKIIFVSSVPTTIYGTSPFSSSLSSYQPEKMENVEFYLQHCQAGRRFDGNI